LCADSLKFRLEAAPVYVRMLYPLKLMIGLIAVRDELPYAFNEFQSLGPSHTAISTDHVSSHKNAFIFQGLMSGIKKMLQPDDVTEGVLRNDRGNIFGPVPKCSGHSR
jgi:hypothetical protein